MKASRSWNINISQNGFKTDSSEKILFLSKCRQIQTQAYDFNTIPTIIQYAHL